MTANGHCTCMFYQKNKKNKTKPNKKYKHQKNTPQEILFLGRQNKNWKENEI